jgi:hypothetical protein
MPDGVWSMSTQSHSKIPGPGRRPALRHVRPTLDYADKDTTRIGDTAPLIVGPAATVYETGKNPDRGFPTL